LGFLCFLRPRMQYWVLSLAAVCLALSCACAWAQTFDATNLREPVELGGTWLVHAGDDPAYVRPEFDDSEWTPFDPHSDIRNLFDKKYQPILWYRLRIKVLPGETGLCLEEKSISRAFELYANGERLTTFGQIAPFVPYTWNAAILQPIPQRLRVSSQMVIALRVHISRQEWNAEGPGYDAGNLFIGQQETLYRENWLTVIGDHSFTWLDHLLTIGLGVVALALFTAQRRQTEYLWIAALGLFTLVESVEPFLSAFYNFPLRWEILSDLLRVATPYIWTSLYFSFIHQRKGWRWNTFLILAGAMNAASGIQGMLFTLPLPLEVFSNLPFIVLLSLIIPGMLGIHWRRGSREAGILLIPALLFSVYIYAEIGFELLFQFPNSHQLGLQGLTFIDHYPLGPFGVSLDNASSILSTFSLAVIMVLRSSSMSRRQAILEGELAAAQQVQQVLLPEQVESVPGFTVETVYEPAEQVGGDFFQILLADDGGLLAVVGDVAGKGLPAAMLVSVLVGAIRGVAEYTSDPAELLASLNERLVGRGGGSFSTALVALIRANGLVTVANAGHLSPYLDGREVELPGALPLGVMSGARYETSEFYLAPGSRLAFFSDGVVEAQNREGELFGFERARDISTQPATAIVEAAKDFGQEDDITVVTIARSSAMSAAA
jgi:sigma-B regulation protein RsbU (phosphoserine phosphatase)